MAAVLVGAKTHGCGVCSDRPLFLSGNIAIAGQTSWPMTWDSTLSAFRTDCISIDGVINNNRRASFYPNHPNTGTALIASDTCPAAGSTNSTQTVNNWTCNPFYIHFPNAAYLFSPWWNAGVTDLFINGPGVPSCGVKGCSTCAPDEMPPVFTVTDGNGGAQATWNGTGWGTPFLCSAPVKNVGTCVDCTGAGTRTAGAMYNYTLSCGGAGLIHIVRNWYTPQTGTLGACYQPCGCTPFVSAGFSAANVVVDCTSLAGSATMQPGANNALSDPVQGTVAFSP
jgi:hypothetical protein